MTVESRVFVHCIQFLFCSSGARSIDLMIGSLQQTVMKSDTEKNLNIYTENVFINTFTFCITENQRCNIRKKGILKSSLGTALIHPFHFFVTAAVCRPRLRPPGQVGRFPLPPVPGVLRLPPR